MGDTVELTNAPFQSSKPTFYKGINNVQISITKQLSLSHPPPLQKNKIKSYYDVLLFLIQIAYIKSIVV